MTLTIFEQICVYKHSYGYYYLIILRLCLRGLKIANQVKC